jgi:branched-chain amino acid aminotransferase
VAWLDGRIVAPDAVGIAIDDHGFTIGDGIFETLLVRDGRPGFWDRHMVRLQRSLRVTGLPPVHEVLITDAVRSVIEASGLRDARLRITLSSGPAPGGLRRGHRPTVLVTANPLDLSTGPPDPVAVVTVPWVRNERGPLVGVKSTSYAEAATLQGRVDALGADDALLGDTRGRVSEALTANVFVELAGRRLTPGTDCGCLAGIVREVLLESGIAEEADIALDAITDATEVFLTSSVVGVRPVASIDGHALPIVDGPMTEAARQAFADAEAADAAATTPDAAR